LPTNRNRSSATDVEDFTWKQPERLLDEWTLHRVLSGQYHGQPESKKIFVDIRASGKGPGSDGARAMDDAGRESTLGHQLLDNFITEQELWACTTCMACVQECPVMIEHVDAIVEMRRGLVLNESRFPDELKVVFSNLERNYTPWGFGHATRADWAQGLDVPVMADVKSADILFWVGCAGSSTLGTGSAGVCPAPQAAR
jgi:Fe-S oxidoreductase